MSVKAHLSQRHHLVFEIIILLLIISFSFLTIFAKQYSYFSFDLTVTQFIQQLTDPNFLRVMQFITDLGYPFLAIPSVVIVVIFLWWKLNPLAALAVVISSAGGHLITTFIKSLVDRPRPDQSLINQIDLLINSSSFPSGHVMYFISFYGLLCYLAWVGIAKPNLRIAICISLAILIGLISISRIYLGAHWFSDVMGSYLLGLVWLYGVIRIYRLFLTKKLLTNIKISK